MARDEKPDIRQLKYEALKLRTGMKKLSGFLSSLREQRNPTYNTGLTTVGRPCVVAQPPTRGCPDNVRWQI